MPKGNATKEYMESLQLKPGEVIYKCPKCCCIKPERAHHCRYAALPEQPLPRAGGPGPLAGTGLYALHVGPGLCVLRVRHTENRISPFQYLQKMYSEDGPSLPVGEQLCRRKESEVFCALHGE